MKDDGSSLDLSDEIDLFGVEEELDAEDAARGYPPPLTLEDHIDALAYDLYILRGRTLWPSLSHTYFKNRALTSLNTRLARFVISNQFAELRNSSVERRAQVLCEQFWYDPKPWYADEHNSWLAIARATYRRFLLGKDDPHRSISDPSTPPSSP